jgi:hypothetical protein
LDGFRSVAHFGTGTGRDCERHPACARLRIEVKTLIW